MVDPSLAVAWSRSLHGRSSPATVAAEGVLVVAERHSRLVRLDPATGAVMWEQRVEDCWGTTAVAPGYCLYLSQRGVLRCFDRDSGRLMWSRPGLELRHHLTVSGSVVLVGGWRGYHPVTRFDLATGEPVPVASPYGPGESMARPWAVGDAVLFASAGRAELRLEEPLTGAVLGAWRLPEPVQVVDAGESFSRTGDGRVVFVSGRRTVMSFRPGTGVETLREHDRDLRPEAPVLIGGRLMVADGPGITVLDGGRTEIASATCNPVPVDGGALVAGRDGAVGLVGGTAGVRLPARVECLFAGGGKRAYAIGQGHLIGLDVHGTP